MVQPSESLSDISDYSDSSPYGSSESDGEESFSIDRQWCRMKYGPDNYDPAPLHFIFSGSPGVKVDANDSKTPLDFYLYLDNDLLDSISL